MTEKSYPAFFPDKTVFSASGATGGIAFLIAGKKRNMAVVTMKKPFSYNGPVIGRPVFEFAVQPNDQQNGKGGNNKRTEDMNRGYGDHFFSPPFIFLSAGISAVFLFSRRVRSVSDQITVQ